MNQKSAVSIALLFFSCFASGLVAKQQLPDPTLFKKGSALYYENGVLKRCKLRRPTVIQGYPCRRWAWFHENGTLRQFQLSEPRTIQNITISVNSTVFLHSDGVLQQCWLSKDTTIQGYPCDGGFMKVATHFHKNGNISCCFLSKHTEIQGIPCKASVFKPVYFHANGKLRTCTLSKHATVNKKEYKKGTMLTLDANGNVAFAK